MSHQFVIIIKCILKQCMTKSGTMFVKTVNIPPHVQPGDLVSGLGLAPVSDLIRVLMVSYNI